MITVPARAHHAGRALPLLLISAAAIGGGAWYWFKLGPGAQPTTPGTAGSAPTAANNPGAPKPAVPVVAPAPAAPTPPAGPVQADAPVVQVSSATAPLWKPFGLYSIDKRLGHKTPGFGVFRSVDAHPKNPDIVIMGGDTTGLWKSADAGKTWKFATHGMPIEQVYSVRFAPSDPRAVWAFTDKGVVVSADGGDTWAFTALARPDALPGARMHGLLAVSPRNPGVALAYADGKVQRTDDAGKTWRVVIDKVLVRDLEFHPKDERAAYVLGGEGGKGHLLSLLISEDAGKTFRAAGKPMEFKTIHRASLAVSPAKPDSLWFMVFGDRDVKTASGEKKSMVSGFYRSDNRGRTIAPVKQAYAFKPQPDGTLGYPRYWPDEAEKKTYDEKKDDSYMVMSLAQIGWDHALTVSDTDPNLIMAGGTSCAYSRDGGKTWTNKNEGEGIHPDIQDGVIRGSRLWVVHDGGINRVELAGGKIVSTQIDGYCGQQLWGFGTSFKTGVAAMGVNHSTIKIHDPRVYENGWYSAGGADAQTAFVNLFDDKWVYGTPWWNEVIRRPLTVADKAPWRRSSVDFGYVPYRTPEPHPNLAYSFLALHKETDPTNPHRTVAQQVARTDDNFHTLTTLWRREGGYARRLRIAPASADTMVVISGPDNKVERTDDGGKSWHDITPAGGKGRYSDVAISDTDTKELWLALGDRNGGKKMLRSHDGGSSWTDYSEGLPAGEIRTLLFQRGTRGGVYAGGHPGLYYRNDDMATWIRYDAGLPYTDTPFLQADYAAGVLRAGTAQGVWEAPLAQDFAPRALIAASHNRVSPGTGTVKFFCHSALPAAGAKWEWSFPGGTPATSTEENPVVSYTGATPGSLAVSLRVTDASGRVSECRLPDFIHVGVADKELGKLKDVLLAVADPGARFGAENSKYICRKLPDQSEPDFDRAEAERSAAKHRARWELFGAAGDDDTLRFERPEKKAE